MAKQKKTITPLEARKRIQEIKDCLAVTDYGAASSLERKLYQDMFDTIQVNQDLDEALILAKLAEKIYKLEFPRDQQ